MKRRAGGILIIALLLMQAGLHADNRFYRVLAAKPNATFEDAVRAFYELALDAPTEELTFEKQTQALVDMKIIKAKWAGKPQAKLTRGRTAYMVCQTCGIKGGLTMRIFGPSERYAFRECVFMGTWTGGNQRDAMTGGELMGVLTWAADYIEAHPKKKVAPRGAPESAEEKAVTETETKARTPAETEPETEKPAPAETESKDETDNSRTE